MRISNFSSWVAVALVAVLTPLISRAVDPQPFVLPVSFSLRVQGVGGGFVTVHGEGSAPRVNAGAESNAIFESSVETASLRPGKSYKIELQASGPTQFWIGLVAPSGYQVYIDGVPKDHIHEFREGGEYGKNYKVQLRPANGAGFLDAGVFTGIAMGQAVSWELGLGGLRAEVDPVRWTTGT